METKDLGKTSIGMQANVAALLSYLAGFVTGIIFYVLEKENKFVRFHAMQSIIISGFLWILNMLIGFIAPFLPLRMIILPLIYITAIILWIILMVKAYQGEYFKLPIAGDIAEKSA